MRILIYPFMTSTRTSNAAICSQCEPKAGLECSTELILVRALTTIIRIQFSIALGVRDNGGGSKNYDSVPSAPFTALPAPSGVLATLGVSRKPHRRV
jgi:hypothetical protein